MVEIVEGVRGLRPLFSCVMPVKGPRPFMEAALESLRCQGMGDELEVIVQDGDVEPDKGQSDAINKGFAKAKGEWLFWLNADDVLLPGALKAVRNAIKRGDVRWIAGGSRYIDEQGCQVNVRFDRRWHDVLFRHMPIWTCGPSSFFSRELLAEVGKLDESLRYVMDNDLWMRFRLAGARYVMLPELLWGFRSHKGSLTLGGAHAVGRHEEWERLLSKYGMRHYRFFLWLSRAVRILDGSQIRAWSESCRQRGVKIA